MSIFSHRHGILAKPHAGVSTLILDNFTAADGTSISGRTPSPTNTPGNAWVVKSGTAATVTSNKMILGSATARYSIETGVADCTVSALLTHGSSSARNPALMLRANTSTSGPTNAATSHWFVAIINGTGVVLVERIAGVDTIRASSGKTIALNTEYLVEAVMSGASITVNVDGVLECSYALAATLLTNTLHGIMGNGSSATGVKFDDFQVTTP